MPKSLRLLIAFAVLCWISAVLFVGSAFVGALGPAAIFGVSLLGSLAGVLGNGGRP